MFNYIIRPYLYHLLNFLLINFIYKVLLVSRGILVIDKRDFYILFLDKLIVFLLLIYILGLSLSSLINKLINNFIVIIYYLSIWKLYLIFIKSYSFYY